MFKRILLWMVFGFASAAAQTAREGMYRPIQYRSAITFVSGYTTLRYARKDFVASRLRYDLEHGLNGLSVWVNINQQQPFAIQPGIISLVLPDSAKLVDRDNISNHPDNYTVDLPAAIEVRRRFKFAEAGVGAQLLTEKEEIIRPDIRELSRNVYYVDYVFSDHRRSSVLAYGFLKTYFGPWTADLMIEPQRVVHFGKDSMHYPIGHRFIPSLTLSWGMPVGQLAGGIGRESWTGEIHVRHGEWSIDNYYSRNFSVNDYQTWKLAIQYQWSGEFTLLGGFETAWRSQQSFKNKSFRYWQSHHGSFSDGSLMERMPHTSAQIGLRYDIGGGRLESLIKTVNLKVFQSRIYAAKRAYYAYNPVGQIELHNDSKQYIQLTIDVYADELGEIYRSPSVTLGPQEIKSVPLFFYLTEGSKISSGTVTQVKIVAETGSKRIALSSFPVTLYDLHSWDGDTWGLRDFIAPEDPEIQSFAKSRLLGSESDTLLDATQKRWVTLKHFISSVGRGIQYVADPTTTFVSDRVQYPLETLRQRSGDCEDLVTFLATNLMAVGHACAVVDIRPSLSDKMSLPTAEPGAVGHVFLLIDTGISSESVLELGLSEFEYIVRPDKTGKMTVWLPLEATVIGQGFEAAHREGVQQYYEEVIKKNGVEHGSVHVYDF